MVKPEPKPTQAIASTAAVVQPSPEAKASLISLATDPTPGVFTEALRRMSPQLVAHLLMIFLIIVGNIVFFVTRKRGGAA